LVLLCLLPLHQILFSLNKIITIRVALTFIAIPNTPCSDQLSFLEMHWAVSSRTCHPAPRQLLPLTISLELIPSWQHPECALCGTFLRSLGREEFGLISNFYVSSSITQSCKHFKWCGPRQARIAPSPKP
jgi:hypothetical protein